MALINLDAMIPRADFCENDVEESSTQKIPSISLQQLGPDSFLVPTLRKPDFQRETNHWTEDQVIVFLKSFLDNELVPSVIFWKSPGKIFVIDGAHRISALLAWVNDDYGDGHISKAFYGSQISSDQTRSAERLRRRVNREIGSYKAFSDLMRKGPGEGADPIFVNRGDNARIRTIDLQWVEGNAEKAESSFFKINKQGTALDKTEERLLILRRKPIAISARSIVRAGTGHKYWSKFPDGKASEIEELAKKLHGLLFLPEIQFPVKSLNLPHAGKSSPISAYNLLMDIISFSSTGTDKEIKEDLIYQDDEDGAKTILAMKSLLNVISRFTGNSINSLGLHPAVYFYSATGRHWDMIFISMVNVFSKACRNNDKNFFKEFTNNREIIESLFLKNKSLIGQANIAIRSAHRIEKWSNLIEMTARGKIFQDGVNQEEILDTLDITGKVIDANFSEYSNGFSTSTKSAAFLAETVKTAHICPLCKGYILVEKSVSYDHINPLSKGGTGGPENIQMTHPYCNSLKGSQVATSVS